MRGQDPNALLFLPTPSARRATIIETIAYWRENNFYPRPPRGGRHEVDFPLRPAVRFLPTPSARRATFSPSSTRTS